MAWLEDGWYNRHKQTYWLLPLTVLFACISGLRRWCYRLGICKQVAMSLPVIVVGNITVGGTGKTPFVLYLCQLLKSLGYRPAIVSRGYGANANLAPFPRLVTAESDVEFSGDEPKLLAMRSGCPVVIAPNRVEAVNYVLDKTNANIVVSDDGLQHYAMSRNVEIVLVDGERKLGNGLLLPVGPLREPKSRLKAVDLVVHNDGFGKAGDYCLAAGDIYSLLQPSTTWALDRNKKVHLVSGIGNPSRFLETARGLGLNIGNTYWFADHHHFVPEDFEQLDINEHDLILLTEKDAVKCRPFAQSNWYVLPISAVISTALEDEVIRLIELNCKK